MDNKLIIPSKITVGYQDHKTHKTGHVTYRKGKKLYREVGWKNYTSDKIPPDEFSNDPISGFKIKETPTQKYNCDYVSFKNHVTIIDPRGFEISINSGNLLKILDEFDYSPTHGFQCELSYAWGTWTNSDLILLPSTSQVYQDSFNFTQLQNHSVTRSDMKAGDVYITKDQKKVVYIGRLDWLEFPSISMYGSKNIDKKLHIFVLLDKINTTTDYNNRNIYLTESGFTRLAKKLNETCPNVNAVIKEVLDSKFACKFYDVIEEVKEQLIVPNNTNHYSTNEKFINYSNAYLLVKAEREYGYGGMGSGIKYTIQGKRLVSINNGKIEIKPSYFNYKSHMTEQDVINFPVFDLNIKLPNNKILTFKEFVS